ncbi:MAG TPA: D-alanyl-D-alanine carboxypeptidase, partial [Balneolales bacterium]|nr:D-alanyl-D-alanine carboxypeptidase [Balneolales bacterium]
MNNYKGDNRIRVIGFFLTFFLFTVFLNACRSSQQLAKPPGKPGFETVLDTSTVLNRAFTGFALYDPATHKMICQQNVNRYFTPASNNKLFTFYTALVTLSDSLPGLQYVQHGDSLIFQGTGDPAFLYPVFTQQPIYSFLARQTDSLYFDPDNFDAKPLGPGWSWDDLNYYYAPERAPFPIYGNVARFRVRRVTNFSLILSDSSKSVIPRSLLPDVRYASPGSRNTDFVVRGLGKNQFTFYPRNDTSQFEVEVPFHYTPEIFTQMLGDTLH